MTLAEYRALRSQRVVVMSTDPHRGWWPLADSLLILESLPDGLRKAILQAADMLWPTGVEISLGLDRQEFPSYVTGSRLWSVWLCPMIEFHSEARTCCDSLLLRGTDEGDKWVLPEKILVMARWILTGEGDLWG